jgi:hypothetical protein
MNSQMSLAKIINIKLQENTTTGAQIFKTGEIERKKKHYLIGDGD